MKKELLKVNPSVGYGAALQPYGFDFFNFNGISLAQPIRVISSTASSPQRPSPG
jgi:hypothetical protein